MKRESLQTKTTTDQLWLAKKVEEQKIHLGDMEYLFDELVHSKEKTVKTMRLCYKVNALLEDAKAMLAGKERAKTTTTQRRRNTSLFYPEMGEEMECSSVYIRQIQGCLHGVSL